MAGGSREAGRSVTSKVLAILGAFDSAHPQLTLTDLARRSGLPLSTVHRLAGELEQWRALSRAPDGRLRIGMRLWELGQLAPARLQDLAHPWLQEVFARTGENVHLAVRDGLEVLYVDKVHGRRAVPIVSRTGGRLPMHPTGVGKALLAYEPDWFVQAYLARKLERPTAHTITEPGRLARELAAVRAQGHALTFEEMSLGSCSAAVPVLVDGRPVAALGIVLSSRRARELHRLVEPLRDAADQIARAYAAASSGTV
ncbi:IclR family transcriptional regulator [Nonomuraea lactucae]|uniref:IclR family transcriptional regulator n=1 Tax=Nonomuraea lactucae TaxID=2249762 RepID=UPI000DE2E866|nr:IclR family transcriptional regulator [Nonomuraea lactucae]